MLVLCESLNGCAVTIEEIILRLPLPGARCDQLISEVSVIE